MFLMGCYNNNESLRVLFIRFFSFPPLHTSIEGPNQPQSKKSVIEFYTPKNTFFIIFTTVSVFQNTQLIFFALLCDTRDIREQRMIFTKSFFSDESSKLCLTDIHYIPEKSNVEHKN